MPRVTDIPYSAIPNQSNLYLDYLGFSAKVLPFFQRPPTIEALKKTPGTELLQAGFPRREITEILERQNQIFGADELTRHHIQDLAREDCVAVVTGQQAGLFTGPLYTIYKACTTLRLTQKLRDSGSRAVPVFWMEVDDHDLAEVTRCTLLTGTSAARVVDYRQQLFGKVPESNRSVGSIKFPEAIELVLSDYAASLPGLTWKNEIRAELESACRPSLTFSESFGRLMSRIFRGYGLVLFDCHDPAAKRLAMPVFRVAVERSARIHDCLTERGQALEAAGYHVQVSILENSTALFLQDNGERKALVRQAGCFGFKSGDERFSVADLLDVLNVSPERFSPNVLLRPLVQDHLFPTVAYIGGPAEVAYFAQIEPIYRLFGRPMPAIWPRASFTLLEPEISDAMDRYGITLSDCFQGKGRLTERILSATSRSSATGILTNLQQYLDRSMEELRPQVTTTDASLGPALDTVGRKLRHHLEGLRARFVQYEASRNGALPDTVDALLNNCYPNSNLQERSIGPYYFLSRHGPALLNVLYPLVEVEHFSHRVVRMD